MRIIYGNKGNCHLFKNTSYSDDKKGFPNLSVREDSREIIIQRKRFFDFLGERIGEGLIRIKSTDSRLSLFYDGKWMDVDMVVIDAKFLSTAIQIGQKFERLSGKSATIIKEF